MVGLRAKPYFLSDEDIAWVEGTIAAMTPEEKVGQLFWQLTACNMAFAPVVDITYNWECEEVLSRAYGNDAEIVAEMGKAFMDGLHETDGVYCCAKHFPGNGQDYRDAHMSNNVNHYPILVNHEKQSWDEAISHGFDKLRSGSYAAYGAEMKQKFLQNLGG